MSTTGNMYIGGDTTQYKVWHAGNDGSGSGLDADKLDGLSSGEFVRADDRPIALFDTACPSGWTRFTALDGRVARGASSYGGTGGASTHTHSIDVPNTGVTGNTGSAGAHTHGAGSYAVDPAAVTSGAQSKNHTHAFNVPQMAIRPGDYPLIYVGKPGNYNTSGISVNHTHSVNVGKTYATGTSSSAGAQFSRRPYSWSRNLRC